MTQIYLVRRGAVAANASELDAVLTRLRLAEEQPATALDAHWLHSYALREADGRFGLACVYRADAAATLRRHASLTAVPVREILAVRSTRMLRPFAPTKVYLVQRHSVGVDNAHLERRLSTARRIADEDMPQQVKWLHSYVLGEAAGTLGTVCLYQAVDPGALREHALRAGLPADDITPVFGRLVFREDTDSSDPSPDQARPA